MKIDYFWLDLLRYVMLLNVEHNEVVKFVLVLTAPFKNLTNTRTSPNRVALKLELSGQTPKQNTK